MARRKAEEVATEGTARVEVADARLDLLLERVAARQERVVLTRRGQPVAALLSIGDLELLEELEDRRDAEEARAAREAFERSGEPTIPWEHMKRDLGL